MYVQIYVNSPITNRLITFGREVVTTRAALRERLDHFRGKHKLDGADAETGLAVGRREIHSDSSWPEGVHVAARRIERVERELCRGIGTD